MWIIFFDFSLPAEPYKKCKRWFSNIFAARRALSQGQIVLFQDLRRPHGLTKTEPLQTQPNVWKSKGLSGHQASFYVIHLHFWRSNTLSGDQARFLEIQLDFWRSDQISQDPTWLLKINHQVVNQWKPWCNRQIAFDVKSLNRNVKTCESLYNR